MANVNEKLYRQEIEELTNFIRNDNSWSDLSNILIENGFNLKDTLLVSFFEDEEMEYGVIVTRDKKVFEYSRNLEVEDEVGNVNISEITENIDKINEYPQIPISYKMIDEGLI